MARRKKTPETSKIARVSTVAYARKHKPGETGSDNDDGDAPSATDATGGDPSKVVGPRAGGGEAKAGEPSGGTEARASEPGAPSKPAESRTSESGGAERSGEAAAPSKPLEATAHPSSKPLEATARPSSKPLEATGHPSSKPLEATGKPSEVASDPSQRADPNVPVEAKAGEPSADPAAPKATIWPEATPVPTRARAETLAMPVLAPVGRPPEVPAVGPAPTAAALASGEVVENPTHMPKPREIPAGSPDDPAPAPGQVPRGDSRSLRKRDARYEFALIYRIETFVISRFGVVGTRGQWRVVEYPTSASASHAYAKECSRFVSEGFSDYRE